MPRLVIVTLIFAAIVLAIRFVRRESARVALKIRRTEKEQQTGARGTLVQDPKTGEYRIDDDRI